MFSFSFNIASHVKIRPFRYGNNLCANLPNGLFQVVKIRPFRYGNLIGLVFSFSNVKMLVKIRPFRYGNVIILRCAAIAKKAALKSDRFGMEISVLVLGAVVIIGLKSDRFGMEIRGGGNGWHKRHNIHSLKSDRFGMEMRGLF